MRKTLRQFLSLILICSSLLAGEPPKKVLSDFNYISFRIDGLLVAIIPVYGSKVYRELTAFQVTWAIAEKDSSGEVVNRSGDEVFPLSGNMRGAYFQAKSFFMDKQRGLLNTLEANFLPPEIQQKK
jgi:hypothetical protein